MGFSNGLNYKKIGERKELILIFNFIRYSNSILIVLGLIWDYF